MLETKLSATQVRFAELLQQTSWLQPYWTFTSALPECDLERLEANMSTWSHGERLMAQFMVAVWFGENRLGFDLVEAASALDPEYRVTVADWIKNPFWP